MESDYTRQNFAINLAQASQKRLCSNKSASHDIIAIQSASVQPYADVTALGKTMPTKWENWPRYEQGIVTSHQTLLGINLSN